MAIQSVILAAGQGKRMCSPLPKVLHQLAGKSLIEHVLDAAMKIAPDTKPIVIYGHQGQLLQERLKHFDVTFVEQTQQLGTAHAVLQALPHIAKDDDVLILCGDVPLISTQTLTKLIRLSTEKSESHPARMREKFSMLTVHLPNPQGYGRIKRDNQNRIMAIIEEVDASCEEKKITEINPGIYFMSAALLKRFVPQIGKDNKQGEYYLTDIIGLVQKEDIEITTVAPDHSEEILGVNDRIQLAHLERFYQRKAAEKLMKQGVTVYDPARLDIRGDVAIGVDTVIDVNVILEGRVIIGHECVIGPNVILRNAIIGDCTQIKANSIIDGAEIATNCQIGPFARIRPGSNIEHDVNVGNFVEIKKSAISQGTKINHLSYIGDSEVGKRVNIGAGTITCNYDGANKHKTIIGDDVFIGSDTQIVAPVTIGVGATIGAGSTITQDVKPHTLTVTQQLKQRHVEHWKRPEKILE